MCLGLVTGDTAALVTYMFVFLFFVWLVPPFSLTYAMSSVPKVLMNIVFFATSPGVGEIPGK